MGQTILGLTVGTPDARLVPQDDTIRGVPAAQMSRRSTASYGEVAKEFPDLMANVKVLSSSLESARGTIGALTTLDAPQAIRDAARQRVPTSPSAPCRARARSGSPWNAVSSSPARRPRPRKPTPCAPCSRAIAVSFGRFRRDSTLLRTVADLRDELSITSALLSFTAGSLARFGQDSIIAVQTAEMSKQMTELFADIRKRPLRYIAF